MSLAELIGISKEEVYEVAEMGYQLMRQGKNSEALKIFEGLLVLNPDDTYLKNLYETLARTIEEQPSDNR